MPKVYPFLNEQYKSSDGTFPIVIYIYHNKRKLHSTGYKSSKKDWDVENKRVRKSHPQYGKLNLLLDGLMAAATTYMTNCKLNAKPFNINHVFNEAEEDGSLISYIFSQVKKFREANRHHAANKYESGANMLKEWHGKDVLFSDITEVFVEKYDSFMRDKRKNSVETRIQKMSELSSLYRQAAERGKAPIVNYFALHEIKDKKSPKMKEWLTDEEVEKLARLEIKKQNLMAARDMYLFSVYCKGMRFINVLYLKNKDIREGRVYWIPAKQDEKRMSQAIHPKLQAVVDRHINNYKEYLFLPDGEKLGTEKERIDRAIYLNKDYNRWLRKVAAMAEINKHLTFHTARHTFAVGAMTKTKNLSIVKDLIGHQDQRSTQIYARGFGVDFLDDLDEMLYGNEVK